MRERRELKSKIFTTRESFAVVMNQNLATCVVEYDVHLKFKEGVLSQEFEEIVKDAMGWRTAAVPKAAVIATHFSPITFLDVIDNNITVLGDSELIIPLRGAAEFSVIRDRGSIDTKKTKEIVCTILEGSPKAFLRRHEMFRARSLTYTWSTLEIIFQPRRAYCMIL